MIVSKMIRLAPSLLLLFFLLISCSTSQDRKKLDTQPSEYFVSVPISKFSSAELPLINIEIEGQQLLAQLDLGFRGHLTIEKNTLNSIGSKTPAGEMLTYGIRGKQYREPSYRIPKVKIGAIAFSSPIVQEENPTFQKDAFLVFNSTTESLNEVGLLGWELFQNSNLLVDIPHSRIAFCDSFETLAKQDYKEQSFVQVPLLLDRGLAEFNAEIPNGNLRCMLDTGATVSILNRSTDEENPLDSFIWDAANAVTYPFLKINGEDFGPITFHPWPIELPIRIEAILGIDFFKNHIVFLDFRKKQIYFSHT